MGYKYSKVRYDGGEEIIETIVSDGTGKRLDRDKVLKKDYPKTVKKLVDWLGIPGIRVEIKKKDDLDWLGY